MVQDLALTARLFTTSSKLHYASACLEKLSHEEDLDANDQEALKWAGRFLCEVDWTSPKPEHENVGGGFALQATSIRPTFYSCLFRIGPKFKEAGLTTEEEILSFLSALYLNLLSPKALSKEHQRLTDIEAQLGILLLHEIAESIMVQINNNGLPRSSTFLSEEWKPTANDLVSTI